MTTGSIRWQCPSNIALIKYWGKRPGQIPLNPSLSITLSESITDLKMEYSFDPASKFNVDFLFEGKPEPVFGRRITDYLLGIASTMPLTRHVNLKIRSSNTFPHSTGIASSASSFGALALALCTMENEITGIEMSKAVFFQKASSLARMGSGSACRSVYGGFVLWGMMEEFRGSGDESAIPITDIHPQFRTLKDSILVVSSAKKEISSSEGHKLMNNNPFAPARTVQANRNLRNMINFLNSGNIFDFIEVVENEAFTLHAMMLSSRPGYLLMLPGTLEIIRKIRRFRDETGLPVGFTLDAGPNVHLIYPELSEKTVKKFIDDKLCEHCEKGRVLHDRIGNGPVQVN
jgi:diphosphomevalonate decarboxylase